MRNELDPKIVRYILSNLPNSGYVWQPFLIAFVFFIIGVVPMFPDPDLDGVKTSLPVFKWISIVVVVFGIVFNYFTKRFYSKKAAVFSKSEVKKTIEEGEIEEGKVVLVAQDHSIRRGSHQTPISFIIIQFEDGSQAQFGMFDIYGFSDFFRGSKIKVLRHKNLRDLAIPLGLFDRKF